MLLTFAFLHLSSVLLNYILNHRITMSSFYAQYLEKHKVIGSMECTF